MLLVVFLSMQVRYPFLSRHLLWWCESTCHICMFSFRQFITDIPYHVNYTLMSYLYLGTHEAFDVCFNYSVLHVQCTCR